ncbi:response regulator [Cohnella sp. GCM10012308]|uniref:response regulator n=1 Tax=Cohnella sp. GCM10012308 TaxID=3317329 RepID=UPI0036154CE8
MWKVVIVEDEAFVRDSLREMIPWTESGFELVGEAGNGEEGAALVETLRPDIVITDIMMPKMDGVMMLKTAREQGSEARFIMLTCMNEFEYARLALEYGASSYILKLSMTIETLQEALAKAAKELSARSEGSRFRRLERYEAVYGKLWDGYESANGAPFAPVFPDIEPPLPYVSVFCLLQGEASGGSSSFVQRLFAEAPATERIVHSYASSGVTTFFCWCSQPGVASVNALSLEGGAVFAYRLDLKGERLEQGWLDVLRRLDALWYGRDKGPIRVGETAVQAKTASSQRQEPGRRAYWGEWLASFEHVKVADCLALLARQWADMERRGLPFLQVKAEAGQLLRLMEQYVTPSPSDYEQIETAVTHGQLLERMERIVSEAVDRIVQERSAFTDHAEINKVIGYIHTNYQKNITLRSMASFASLDESYLSSLFKRKTGFSLIQFVQQVRVDRAKELLAEGKSVSQAAELVGFVNDSYFIKIFRRFETQSPAEFKKSLAAGRG